MTKTLKALRVIVRLHWGFSIKYPLYSATQPSLRLPPPTSLLGALAYPLSIQEIRPEVIVVNGAIYSSTVILMDVIPWLCYRILDLDPRWLVETKDISRVLIVPYIRNEHVYPGSPNIWAVQAHGKIYAPTMTLDIVYIVTGSKNNIERLTYAAWGISRVGIKEALVSTVEVELLDVVITSEKHVSTKYSFPRSLAEPIEGEYMLVRLPTLERDWYRLAEVRNPTRYMEDYYLPIDEVEVNLKEEGVAIQVDKLGHIIVPRKVLEL